MDFFPSQVINQDGIEVKSCPCLSQTVWLLYNSLVWTTEAGGQGFVYLRDKRIKIKCAK